MGCLIGIIVVAVAFAVSELFDFPFFCSGVAGGVVWAVLYGVIYGRRNDKAKADKGGN